MGTEGTYDMKDIESHPPINPVTHRPYDSVVYVQTANNKEIQFKRAMVYDAGQVYVEYGVEYTRAPRVSNR